MMTTFDPSGRMVTQVDRHEQGLSYGYDASGRLVTVADASGRSAALTYGAAGPGAGLVTSVALSDGRTWTYTYAFAGDGTSPLLTSVTDPAASTTKYLYDPTAKDLTEVVDGNGHAIASISYGGGQVTSLTEAANTGGTHGTYSWRGGDDGTGTATTTDAKGGEWTDVYDGNNLVAETNPLNQTTRYRYDDHNNRTAVIQPDGATTSYTYDAAGNALTKTDPLGDTTTYTYDADNNLTSQTDPLGPTTTYT
jgi:YD repeat-containing protein